MSKQKTNIDVPENIQKFSKDHRDGWQELLPGDKDFVQMRKPGEINVSDFRGQEGKYLSTVFDDEAKTEKTLYKTSRTQIRAAYIKNKNQITELKIQKFDIKKDVLQPNPAEVRISIKNLDALIKFLDFLKGANLSSVAAGTLTFEKELSLDPELEGKLKALASDSNGKKQLLELFDQGYLTSDLDIPQLIKQGLSRQVIDEKLTKLNEFVEMINDDNVKEVGDIQNWLKENPWIFGPEYKNFDFRDAGFSGYPDGRLLRIDGLSDVLEVKLPNAELLRVDGRKRQFIAPALAEAIGQLTGYLEYYYSEYSLERDDATGEEIQADRYGKYYKPKGILLIGRRLVEDGTSSTFSTINANPKNLRRLLSYFHWVEVLTYDDLIERARNGLNCLVE